MDSNRANEINESENKINSKEASKKKDKNKKKKKCEYINQGEDECKQKLLRISKENEWVHLSCALWIAEVKIQKYDTKSDISGKIKLKKISKILIKRDSRKLAIFAN